MKVLLFTVFAVAIFSCSAQVGGWTLNDNKLNDKLIQKIQTALSQAKENELGFSAQKARIVEVYLHLTQVVAGILHRVTFRAELDGVVKIVQIDFFESLFSATGPQVTLYTHHVFDSSAKFTAVPSSTQEELVEAVVKAMSILKPDVQSYVPGGLIASAKAKNVHGEDYYYVKTTVQGTDNRIALYEFWFKKFGDEEIAFNDFELYSYVQLKMNQQSMEQQGDLTQITKENGEVDCSLISSYFVCSALPQCNSSDFINFSQCKNKASSIFN